MAELLETKKAKDRSPGFPFITLERALDRARMFYDEEKRGAVPFSRAVMHWNYSELSSGAVQTVAALKSYGLLEDVGGSGKARQLKLSDLALRILLDQRPDSDERASYIRQAAVKPAVAAEVYGKWPERLPQDSTLNHFLVLEKKFNEATAGTAIKILKENHAFARIEFTALESERLQKSEDLMLESAVRNEILPPASVNVAPHRRSPAVAAMPTLPPSPEHTQLQLRHDGVTITLSFSEEPTAELYEYLGKFAAFQKDQAPKKKSLVAGLNALIGPETS